MYLELSVTCENYLEFIVVE